MTTNSEASEEEPAPSQPNVAMANLDDLMTNLAAAQIVTEQKL